MGKENLEEISEEKFIETIFSSIDEYTSLANQYLSYSHSLSNLLEEVEFWKSEGYRIKYYVSKDGELGYIKIKQQLGFKGD